MFRASVFEGNLMTQQAAILTQVWHFRRSKELLKRRATLQAKKALRNKEYKDSMQDAVRDCRCSCATYVRQPLFPSYALSPSCKSVSPTLEAHVPQRLTQASLQIKELDKKVQKESKAKIGLLPPFFSSRLSLFCLLHFDLLACRMPAACLAA